MKKYKFFLLLTSFIILVFYSCQGEGEGAMYQQKRFKMVKTQIENRGISDKAVLEAMRTVQRHLFVPDSLMSFAYKDDPLPIGFDQTISQPYIVALMTEKLDLKPTDRVLEIGTGSGYQAAVLAELVDSVFTIEIIKGLADRSSALLKELDYKNITVKHGDGYIGWAEKAPFDAIIVTAAPDEIPQPLVDQLKDNGRLIIPVGETHQHLILLKKINDQIIKSQIAAVRFVPMTGEAEKLDSLK